jgi:Icc-related predicted phosphoesterase
MIKFLYATDLHGNHSKYRKLLDLAIETKTNLIHLGADILPKGHNFFDEQKCFIKYFLKDFYAQCNEKNIKVLASFGNDDLYTYKKLFKEYGDLLDEKPYSLEDYTFYSYNFVPDNPFGLKTACKLDSKYWKFKEEYWTNPVEVVNEEFCPIADVDKYFREKGTIENDLKKLKCKKNSIVAFHCPPAKNDLDVCENGKRVGSEAIYKWIMLNQPDLCLCGHIHESYKVTSGIWQKYIGNTLVVQPGQLYTFRAVLIEIDKDNLRTDLIEN